MAAAVRVQEALDRVSLITVCVGNAWDERPFRLGA
jgi:hypothetical protein